MDEEQKEKGLVVVFGEIFESRYYNFPAKDREKIFDFTYHIQINGFGGLPGRNKASTDVDKDDHLFIEKVRYAREHSLYHYHIGIPDYKKDNQVGDWTSEYILHYKYLDNVVTILDLDSHPPFTLPPKEFLI